MKKILVLLVLVLTVFSLVACENKKVSEEVNTTEKKETVNVTARTASGDKVKVDVIDLTGDISSLISSGEKIEPVESGENIVIDANSPTRYSHVTQNPVVTMEMNNGKVVKIELYPQIAPTTVENFISLINNKFYDGVIFHRVIPSFMAQGGDPKGNGLGGPGYSIKGEFSENGFAQNNIKHDVGILSMARATSPDSAGSQFFIVTGERSNPSVAGLDGKYAAFGKVIEGMDVVYEIVKSEVNFSTDDLDGIYNKLLSGEQLTNTEIALVSAYQAGEVFDRPINPPTIKKMTVDTFGIEYAEPEMIK